MGQPIAEAAEAVSTVLRSISRFCYEHANVISLVTGGISLIATAVSPFLGLAIRGIGWTISAVSGSATVVMGLVGRGGRDAVHGAVADGDAREADAEARIHVLRASVANLTGQLQLAVAAHTHARAELTALQQQYDESRVENATTARMLLVLRQDCDAMQARNRQLEQGRDEMQRALDALGGLHGARPPERLPADRVDAGIVVNDRPGLRMRH